MIKVVGVSLILMSHTCLKFYFSFDVFLFVFSLLINYSKNFSGFIFISLERYTNICFEFLDLMV